jgi:hypothetical protein
MAATILKRIMNSICLHPAVSICVALALATSTTATFADEQSDSKQTDSKQTDSKQTSSAQPIPAQQVAAKIDGFLESHWSAHKVQPADRADDATFLRRLMLDLNGRIPTTTELDKFLSDQSNDKRRKLVDRLINGPEFPLHLGSVLDQMIQTRYAGNKDFVDYMRKSVRDSKSWDTIFRELMLGPWDTDQSKPSNRFLDKRAKKPDVLAVDTARVFFGVDISCAKCHDHPLVDDWKQEHFYGMVAFFNRTTAGKGKIGEKNEGEVTFLGADGKENIAKVMFLSGHVIEEPTAATAKSDKDKLSPFSRREELVKVAIEQQNYFSRAIVNRLWGYFFGQGLIHPVDQMHSGNESAIPGLLEWLSNDFAKSNYDLRKLVAALVTSRAYQLSSRWEQESPLPAATLFAAATLRPLSQRQLAFSLLQATGNADISEPNDIQSRLEGYFGVTGLRRIEQYLTIEQQSTNLTSSLDPRSDNFHSSVAEALFMSNNAAAQELVTGETDNLSAQLNEIQDHRKLVTKAVNTILSRQPSEDELTRLSEWLAAPNKAHGKINNKGNAEGSDRRKALEQLVWSLITSAEFRFNH